MPSVGRNSSSLIRRIAKSNDLDAWCSNSAVLTGPQLERTRWTLQVSSKERQRAIMQNPWKSWRPNVVHGWQDWHGSEGDQFVSICQVSVFPDDSFHHAPEAHHRLQWPPRSVAGSRNRMRTYIQDQLKAAALRNRRPGGASTVRAAQMPGCTRSPKSPTSIRPGTSR